MTAKSKGHQKLVDYDDDFDDFIANHLKTVKVECTPAGGGGVLSAAPAEEASRHPGEKVMSSKHMSPFGLRPTLPSNTT